VDSGRGGAEFAGVFEPVASLAVSFVSEFMFWQLVGGKILKYAPAKAGGIQRQLPLKHIAITYDFEQNKHTYIQSINL